MADDAAELVLAVVLERGLAGQVRNRDHPAEPGFGAVLPDRDQTIRPVEGAGHDLDAGAVDAAKTQRRAAVGYFRPHTSNPESVNGRLRLRCQQPKQFFENDPEGRR